MEGARPQHSRRAFKRRSYDNRRRQARPGSLRSSRAALRPSQSATLRRPCRPGRTHHGADLGYLANATCCSQYHRAYCSMRRHRAARAQRLGSRPPGGCFRSPRRGGLAFGSRASCSASSPAISSPPTPLFLVRDATETELLSGGLAISLPDDRPAILRGLSLRQHGPAVLIVDEASRVRDELWATISPMLAAAPGVTAMSVTSGEPCSISTNTGGTSIISSIQVSAPPRNGTARTGEGDAVWYQSRPGFIGSDAFEFTVAGTTDGRPGFLDRAGPGCRASMMK